MAVIIQKKSLKSPEDLIAAWVDMWNSYDLSKIENLFLKDSRLTYFSSEKEGLIKGIEAIRKHYEGFGFIKGGKTQEYKLWLEDINTEIYGDTAVITAIWYFQRIQIEDWVRVDDLNTWRTTIHRT
jgi:ketosteroid isomerase-like protein